MPRPGVYVPKKLKKKMIFIWKNDKNAVFGRNSSPGVLFYAFFMRKYGVLTLKMRWFWLLGWNFDALVLLVLVFFAFFNAKPCLCHFLPQKTLKTPWKHLKISIFDVFLTVFLPILTFFWRFLYINRRYIDPRGSKELHAGV
jgi:hypothetical protein